MRLHLDEKEKDIFLPSGATGNGTVYTDAGQAIHILRKVIMRVGSYVNYLVLKLH